MRRLLAVLVVVPWVAGGPPHSPGRADPARDSALHVLNRLAWGPRPGDLDRVASGGVLRWVDRQLDATGREPAALRDLEAASPALRLGREDLAGLFADWRRERRDRAREPGTEPGRAAPARDSLRRLGAGLQQVALTRAVLAENQLREVLADFWFNHFNVFLGKSVVRFLLPEYVEHTIRPRVLGRYEDLLLAVARSPAMLAYLDNVLSVAEGMAPPPRGRGAAGAGRRPTGLNENYARELLELHTLGVDGGYTQDDVVNVARILTGWGLDRRGRLEFEFHARAHDRGEKTVLGHHFPSGHGEDEGRRLIRILANHPSTARHVSRRLCARLVRDQPPDGCVEDAVRAWERSGGAIREVVRAIVHGADFWAPANRLAKVKTPVEFVVSAIRALDGVPDSTARLAMVVARLGQPLYLQPSPAGYPEAQEDWANSGAMLARMNLAVSLAAGRLPGVTLPSIEPPDAASTEALVGLAAERVLGRPASPRTTDAVRSDLEGEASPVRAFRAALGLLLGGPEFQRQ